MTEESNSLGPYNYQEVGTSGSFQYVFETDLGLSYSCWFADGSEHFKDYNQIKDSIVTFGFRCKPYTPKGYFHKYDPKIKPTILSILRQSLETYPERVVLVMYQNTDHRKRNRKITFDAWYKDFCEEHSFVGKFRLTIPSPDGSDITCITMFVPETYSKTEQLKDALMDFKDELISKGLPPATTTLAFS
ncbi:hypothetical protein [Dyadobacter sp. CY347]|uniref:hypothetical protein n=1 Tax=Dyadobacter sp. CY347 TaxID=2909336 RepID=UPI001F2C1E1C|nr:hypothetical protein [Dyadobacter sp. CY347]MCF2490660.1 hypothetical protein [Dyadobacter sp. CY347]